MKPSKPPKVEAAHDILRGRQHPLDVFFSPERVAKIKARYPYRSLPLGKEGAK